MQTSQKMGNTRVAILYCLYYPRWSKDTTMDACSSMSSSSSSAEVLVGEVSLKQQERLLLSTMVVTQHQGCLQFIPECAELLVVEVSLK